MVRNALAPFAVASIVLLVTPAFGPGASGSPDATALPAARLTPPAGARTAASDPEHAFDGVLRATPGLEAVRRIRAARPPVRYGVAVEALAAANDLRPDAVLPVGKTLVIPGGDEGAAARRTPVRTADRARRVTYVVQPGDTLWSIAFRHGTTVEALMHLNGLDDPDRLRPGQRLAVSGGAPRARAAQGERIARAGPVLRGGLRLIWPARGVITSRFGWRRYRYHHNGIDVASPAGAPIYAAGDGVVAFAGWRGGYGRVVYLRHHDGVTSVYAHASQLLVRAGARVKRGQLIARVGCTGVCTGPHLHFEVQVGGRPVNPIRYLQ